MPLSFKVRHLPLLLVLTLVGSMFVFGATAQANDVAPAPGVAASEPPAPTPTETTTPTPVPTPTETVTPTPTAVPPLTTVTWTTDFMYGTRALVKAPDTSDVVMTYRSVCDNFKDFTNTITVPAGVTAQVYTGICWSGSVSVKTSEDGGVTWHDWGIGVFPTPAYPVVGSPTIVKWGKAPTRTRSYGSFTYQTDIYSAWVGHQKVGKKRIRWFGIVTPGRHRYRIKVKPGTGGRYKLFSRACINTCKKAVSFGEVRYRRPR